MTDHLPDDLMRAHKEWLKEHPQLDPEEHKIVLEVVDAWRGWKAFGKGLKLIVVLLGTLAATSLAFDQLWAKLKALMAP